MEREGAARPYAFFDLDGTLLPWDTQLLLAAFVFRRSGWRRFFLVPVLLALPLKLGGLVDTRTLKRLFLGFLSGLEPGRIEAMADEFVDRVALPAMWPEMLAEIESRRGEGCVLVLNTASPGFYAERIARRLGFDHCVATGMEMGGGERLAWPPAFSGPNNKRRAKVEAMRARGWLAPGSGLPLPGAWAYTDSAADLPLLECAEFGVLVHPRRALRVLGEAKGWRVLRPLPAVSRWRRVILGMALLFGCWNPSRGSNR
ncbi:MAG: haloacid dehalogenase-like hydrolase [Verrucomicrobia bacterium]|nr:haloacid dehalogenase-like hydrolase [Verrucomicrobiota bacterium]